MKIFDGLIKFVKKEIEERASLSPINRDTLIESIQENIKSLRSAANSIKDTSYNKNGLLLSFNAKKINVVKGSIDFNALNIPNAIAGSLSGRARIMEDQSFLNSVLFTCNILSDVNKKMLKDIDKVIVDKSIIINKVKVTDIYCLSLIKQSEFYSSYCNNLIGLISSVISNIHDNYPKYRQAFLTKNYGLFIDITNRICNSSNNVFSLRDIQRVKDAGMNFQVAEGDVLSGVVPTAMTHEMTFGLMGFILFPNPFRFFSELMVDHKHSVFLKNKETKEWLEYHVALLKMDEQNMDKNSTKYITTTKAIEFYEDKIAKKQAEIDKYLEE